MISLLIDLALFICVILLFRRNDLLQKQNNHLRTELEMDRTKDRLSLENNIRNLHQEIEIIKKSKSKQVLKG